MARCQFIYLRSRGEVVEGGQCESEAGYVNQTFCQRHRNVLRERAARQPAMEVRSSITTSDDVLNGDQGFPRQCSVEEIQTWVDEARRRTDPMMNWHRGCIICGRATRDLEMMGITVSDLVAL